MIQAALTSLLAAFIAGLGVSGVLIADATNVDLLREVSQLDAPTLLVLFIVLLYKRKLVWGYQLDEALREKDEWKATAQARTQDAEHTATIAEAALRSGLRTQGRR